MRTNDIFTTTYSPGSDPLRSDGFIKRGAMIPTLQQLINKTTWSTELCSTTKVEVQNER